MWFFKKKEQEQVKKEFEDRRIGASLFFDENSKTYLCYQINRIYDEAKHDYLMLVARRELYNRDKDLEVKLFGNITDIKRNKAFEKAYMEEIKVFNDSISTGILKRASYLKFDSPIEVVSEDTLKLPFTFHRLPLSMSVQFKKPLKEMDLSTNVLAEHQEHNLDYGDCELRDFEAADIDWIAFSTALHMLMKSLEKKPLLAEE